MTVPCPRLSRPGFAARLARATALALLGLVLIWSAAAGAASTGAPSTGAASSGSDAAAGVFRQSGTDAQPTAGELFRLTAEARGDGVRLHWRVPAGFYLYRSHISVHDGAGRAVALDLPQGEVTQDPVFGRQEVYRQDMSVLLPRARYPLTVRWQGCAAGGICYPPVTRAVTAAGLVVPAQVETGQTETGQAETGQAGGGNDGAVAQRGAVFDKGGAGLGPQGAPVALVLLSFLGLGILLAFTPCVLPMFPILLGLLARGGERLTPVRGAVLALSYVLAMATAFAGLGAGAAVSGQNLQGVLQAPVAIWGMAALFVLLALSSFGLFEIALPAGLAARIGRMGPTGRGSIAGAAALGFTSALIVGPCVTAPLAGALLYIARSGDVALGSAALFALGVGQGVPLIAAGALGAKVLPRAGRWMEAVRRVFGLLFLGMAVWLLGRVVPGPAGLALWSALLVGAGVFLGGGRPFGPGRWLARAGGVAAILVGAVFGLGAAAGGSDPLHPLAPLVATGAQRAEAPVAFETAQSPADLDRLLSQRAGRAALVYVTADWCTSCAIMKRTVFSDPEVKRALDGVQRIAIDVSRFDAGSKALMAHVGAAGPPTMIFLAPDGAEAPKTRLVGETGPQNVLKSLRAAGAG